MNENGKAIIESIHQLGERLDTRMGAMEKEQTAMSGELAGLRGDMTAVRRDVTAIGIRLTTVETRLANIETAAAGTDLQIRSWPDMHFLGSAVKHQIASNREIKAEMTDLKARLKEIYQAKATDPEIKVLRDEVARFRNRSADVDITLGAIESRLGMSNEPIA